MDNTHLWMDEFTAYTLFEVMDKNIVTEKLARHSLILRKPKTSLNFSDFNLYFRKLNEFLTSAISYENAI